MKLYRKLTALCLSAALAAGMAITASADVSPVRVVVNGETASNSAYINSDWRTMVPVETAEAMGIAYTVEGDSVTFTANGISQTYTAGSAAGDTVATLVDGTLYVPFYHLAQTFGFQVSWDSAAKAASAVSSVQPSEPDAETAVDLDSITALEIDWTQAAQLPLTGYFTKSFEDGRSVKVYISEEASIRTYITVVAVPDGVSTRAFLEDEGWLALADQKGEALFVLEPGADGWGSAAEESAYLEEAIAFLKSGSNANKVGVFSTFGEFYLVGYGKGAAPLEMWAAQNPIFVISQAYLDGESVGKAELERAGASKEYDGVVSGNGYTPIENLDEVIQKIGISGRITAADVPVPSWFVNYDGEAENIDYWKAANDTVSAGEDGAFYQDINSDAYQTEYANKQILKENSNARHGISQVRVSQGHVDAGELYAFLSVYTRYDNSLGYSNAMNYRLDYTAARVAAQQEAKDGRVKSVLSDGTEIWGQGSVTIPNHGTVQVGVIAFADDNGDGKADPREYLVYIPQGFEGEKLPIMYVYPGNTQSDVIFFDSTSWMQVAEEKGIVLAFICESYSSPVAITHLSPLEFLAAINTVMEEEIDGKYAKLDFTRIYASGQSMGSMYVQDIARSAPENFAAVATTSGIVASGTPIAAAPGSGNMIPAAMICGQGDNMTMTPDLWGSELSSEWASYLLEVNGAKGLTEYDSVDELVLGRTNMYTWLNSDEIPVFQWGQTLLRPHNCYPSDMWILWDFVEHYRLAEDGTRYYSASAFAQDDAVKIS